MAHCNLCNKNTRCSCKWGGCPNCWSTNKQIAVMNDLLKFWLSKETLKSKLSTVKEYTGKIDAFTLYEYCSNQITEEQFNEAVKDFSPTRKKIYQSRKESEVVDTTWRVNPDRKCVFKWKSARDRCIYCNSIRKYMEGKECPKYSENPGTTDTENE